MEYQVTNCVFMISLSGWLCPRDRPAEFSLRNFAPPRSTEESFYRLHSIIPIFHNVGSRNQTYVRLEVTANRSAPIPISIRRRSNCWRNRNPRYVSSRRRKNAFPITSRRVRRTIQQHARLCPQNNPSRGVHAPRSP